MKGPKKYRVSFMPAGKRSFDKLPKAVRKKILPRIEALSVNPRPPGVKKLEGSEDFFRLRIGQYRVVYQIQNNMLLVLVVRVRHRRDVYTR